MPRSRWIITVALGLIAILCGWLSWSAFSAYQQNQSYERQGAPLHDAYTGQQSIQTCWPIVAEGGFIDGLTCLAKRISAQEADHQAYHDLKAQHDMALWAFGMLIVTVWIAVITLVGVLFVWRTLKATQDMARETSRIGEAQASANLHLVPQENLFVNGGNTAKVEQFYSAFMLHNLGITAATEVFAKSFLTIKVEGFGDLEISTLYDGPTIAGPSDVTRFTKGTSCEGLSNITEKNICSLVGTLKTSVSFRDVFNNRKEVTGQWAAKFVVMDCSVDAQTDEVTMTMVVIHLNPQGQTTRTIQKG